MGGEDEDGGAIPHSGSEHHRPGDPGKLGACEGAHGILSAASSRPSSFLADPGPPSPGRGKLFHPLLPSSDPSSLASRPSRLLHPGGGGAFIFLRSFSLSF